jgi:hypothetical protein
MAILKRYLEAARVPAPVIRRLRVLAFDPSLAIRLDTAAFNEIIVEIPWEELAPGPVGEYVEVVDFDPASGVFYHPVQLDNPHLLAQGGLGPSESNPQFHQQMVYAVAMTTIRHFERALGRVALWADRRVAHDDGSYVEQFVRRLRIYPHALRDRNAYYSPSKKALLFGYFPVASKDQHNTPGTLVFTCLSHDIIAHETTHALLDGVHPRFNEPTNPDVHAFHEAFADIGRARRQRRRSGLHSRPAGERGTDCRRRSARRGGIPARQLVLLCRSRSPRRRRTHHSLPAPLLGDDRRRPRRYRTVLARALRPG